MKNLKKNIKMKEKKRIYLLNKKKKRLKKEKNRSLRVFLQSPKLIETMRDH